MRFLQIPLCVIICCSYFHSIAQNVPDYVPSDGLVAWWNLDNEAEDQVGNNDGTLQGTSGIVNRFGEQDQAMGFDEGDYVSLNTFFDGQQMTEVSYSVWFLSEDNGETQYISGKEGFWRTIYLRIVENGELRFGGTSGGVYFGVSSSEGAIQRGVWNHAVVTFSNSEIDLYLNGELLTSGPSATSFLDYQFYAAGNSTATNYLGAIHPVSAGIWKHLKGGMDEFGLWNRALTETEILSLYNYQGAGSGCMDSNACNYDSNVAEDDGSCEYAVYGRNCDGSCQGGTLWYVNGTAEATGADGGLGAPFPTIQAACDAACASDTILIAPGTYIENVSLTTESVTLMGHAPTLDPESVAQQVIIDGAELGTTLFVSGAQAVLADLTIQNGLSSFGAGLYMDGCNGTLVQRCVIRDNVGTGDITAHGIQLGASNCIIEDCLITGNYGRKHTVNAAGSDNIIRNCRIVDNDAWETGGGIVVYTANMLIENCLIADNNNGGVTTYKEDTVIDHCTIVDNTGFGCFIWCYSNDADFYITNSIIANNGDSEFKMLQTGDKVATAHLRHSLVEGGVDYDWLSVYKQFDVDASLNSSSPSFLSTYELASNSAGIGEASAFRYGLDGTLSVPASAVDLDFEDRPIPAGSSADLGCFEHPLGTPELTALGCTDSTACNYDSDATVDDESCISAGCMDEAACNFDSSAGCSDDSCLPYDTVVGCMDSDACNFDATALCSDDSCVYPLVDNDCDSGASVCAEGTTWNLEEQTCDAIACEPSVDSSACGPGTYWDTVSQQCLPIDDPSNEEGITDGDALVYVPASAADFLRGQVVGNRVFMELDCTLLLDSVALLNAALANASEDVDSDSGSNEFTCGDPMSYHGYDYATVQIGDQCWFAENLRSTQFTDGSAIPTSAVDPFGDNASNIDAWGLMYEGTAVVDSRGLCPSGWHISSNADWQQLINYAANNGYSGNESSALKSASGWSSGANGIDAFGFNAKPGGFHYNPTHPTWGEFNHSMTSGYWWTSTIQSASESIAWTLQNSSLSPSYYNSNGMSVRCLEDTEQPN